MYHLLFKKVLLSADYNVEKSYLIYKVSNQNSLYNFFTLLIDDNKKY